MLNQSPIQLLATLDENYLLRLQVLLTSVFINNPEEKMELYLIHRNIPEKSLEKLRMQCRSFHYPLHLIQVDASFFQNAPVSRRYPQEMYYRLLAPHLLPGDLDRNLYLDPDTLVINALRPLWETNLNGNLFAAASHTVITAIAPTVNRLRLWTDSAYFNSGVLLMDLKLVR